ncbi:hypothetical protein LXA43DRAFT_847840, partial [Ganoderma leucocontextum]
IVLLGDFNARTGARSQTRHRVSPDDRVCARGNDLLRLCESHNMEVVNGTATHLPSTRMRFTSYQPNGSSVIDYAIVSGHLVDEGALRSLSVRPHYPLRSDHAPLALEF